MNHLLGPIQELWPGLEDWCKDNSILWRGYHGGGLDGNNSMKLLQNLDLLKPAIHEDFHPIIDTLELFKGIVQGCFSHTLCPDYKSRINQFRESYQRLMAYCERKFEQHEVKLTVSWKVHCVTAHLEDVLTKLQKGLAMYAEQTGEAAHHKMKPVMARHHRSEDHKDHGVRQLAAVSKFASWNLKSAKQLVREKGTK